MQHDLFLRRLFHETVRHSAASVNVSVSPMSVFAALSLVVGGAKGQTYNELREVFGGKGDADELLPELSGAYKCLAEDKSISIANNVFAEKNVKLEKDYIDTVTKLFSSEITTDDAFFSNSAQSSKIINGWVSERTKGLITNLVSAKDIKPDDVLILVNAIFFKALWKEPFAKADTNNQAHFNLTARKSTLAPLMTKTNKMIEFGEDEVAKWTSMQYDNSEFRAVFILPQKSFDTKSVADHFFGSDAKTPEFKTESTKLEQFAIPRFKLHSNTSLVKHLERIGINTAFTEKADFSGISSTPSFISNVIHDVHIEVDEEGTVAAAATAIKLTKCKRDTKKQRLPSFVADEPFFFLVMHQSSMVFAARICNPTTN